MAKETTISAWQSVEIFHGPVKVLGCELPQISGDERNCAMQQRAGKIIGNSVELKPQILAKGSTIEIQAKLPLKANPSLYAIAQAGEPLIGILSEDLKVVAAKDGTYKAIEIGAIELQGKFKLLTSNGHIVETSGLKAEALLPKGTTLIIDKSAVGKAA